MALTESPSMTMFRRDPVVSAGRDAGQTVVWLRGEHDLSTVAALSEALARAIALDDADLVVDLSGVEFMGAATVLVLTRASEFLRLRTRSLALRSPSRCARRILDLCGLGDLLDRHPVDASGTTGTAGALAMWVAVPATARADRRHDASSREPGRAEEPARSGGVTASNVAGDGRP